MRQLTSLYAEADRLLEGWSCERSGDCCHFGRTGREPVVWPAEWALLDKAIAARGTRRGALPIIAEEGRCPLLGGDGRCTVYAARPFGCRTFFCERAEGPTRRPPRAALAEIGREIASLAEPDRGGDGPRPLTSWLAARGKRC